MCEKTENLRTSSSPRANSAKDTGCHLAGGELTPQSVRHLSESEAKAFLESPTDTGLLDFLSSENAALALLLSYNKPFKITDEKYPHPFIKFPRLRLGFSNLDSDKARILSFFKGWLMLDNVSSLSDEAEVALAKRDFPTSLEGLRELKTAELASHLGHFGKIVQEWAEGWPMSFSGDLDWWVPQQLELITDEAAEALAAHRPSKEYTWQNKFVKERNLEAIDQKTASLLATVDDDLYFDSLRALSPDAAKELAKTSHSIFFENLKDLSLELALALADFDPVNSPNRSYRFNKSGGCLSFGGLVQLAPGVAEVFGKSAVLSLYFPGLETITEQDAESLSNFRGEKLGISGLKELSATAAWHLGKLSKSVLLVPSSFAEMIWPD